MLVYGECKVLLRNVGERQLLDNRNVFKLKYNKKNSNNYKFPRQEPLLDNFDPDNSPLKQINFMEKSYQNNRIVIDAKGNKIDKNILYEDQIEFKQIKPGSTFGGRMMVPFKFYHNII